MSRNYDDYEAMFDPMNDRQARRKRKQKAKHTPKKTIQVQELAEDTTIENGFDMTYQPSKHEGGWLLESLTPFFTQSMISDVLAVVKGGKEASVYRCEGTPVTGHVLLAAKVYRPRMFRQLRNDSMYRQGRDVLTEAGSAAKKTDHRLMRAIGKKTTFGAQAAHTSWLMHEFMTLKKLYEAGASVPQPISAGTNAILMSYHGDENMPAPTLSEIDLEPDEVEPLFDEIMRNIMLMLEHDMIHGDLSAYNILYWEGEITIIDFPQVTNKDANPNAYEILERDITRICEYFAEQGLERDPEAIMQELYLHYLAPDPRNHAADVSRLLETDPAAGKNSE